MKSETNNLKKNPFVGILIAAFSVFLLFLAAEMIMRFAWRMSGWVERPIYRRSLNPYLRYELVPNVKSGQISINSVGFRGRECPLVKPENTFRIVMLGDSETFSYMLKEEEALPAQLETILNKNSLKLHYEVLNFGVEGYNTFQELEMLKTKGLKYSPDLVILNYVFNDPEPGEYYFNKTFLMRHSALVRYFTYRIKKALIRRERKKLGVGTRTDHYLYLHQPKYFSRVTEAILEMTEISKKLGTKLVVVIFPESSLGVMDFKDNYPYWQLHELVKGINSGNIIFIDLIEEFNRLNLTPQDVSINYQYNESHKNPRALSISASYIYNLLRDGNVY